MSQIFSATPVHSPRWITDVPIAHRGLHDKEAGIFENTLAAAKAASDAGYAIEVDLQPSVDTVPMVFHDYELKRLTTNDGLVRQTSAEKLTGLQVGGSDDSIPALSDLLETVSGKSGLVLEMKGKENEDKGFVEAVATLLKDYKGNVAIMSFAHWILEDARAIAPELPLGLVAYGREEEYDNHCTALKKYNFDFLSYNLKELDGRFVSDFRETGRPVISWTVRSPEDAMFSSKYADQITFEGFRP